MADAAVTSKGQITIPAEIRREMGLKAGDRVTFTRLPGGTTVMRAKTRRLADLAGSVKSDKRVSVADMRMD